MSILEKLKGDLSFSIKYYGESDYSTYQNLEIIFSKKEIIENHFDNMNDFKLLTYNKFLDYLFLSEQIKYSELDGYINNEKDVLIYVNYIKKIFDKYDTRDIITYINNNFESILKISKLRYVCESFEEFNEKYDFDIFQYQIEDLVIYLIAKYLKGINEDVMNYIIKYYLPEIYNKMDLFYSYFKINYAKLLTEDNIKESVVNSNKGLNRIDDIAEFLVKLNNGKVDIEKYLDSFIKIIKENYFISSCADFLESHSIIQMLVPYLEKLRSAYYHDFVEEEELQQRHIDKWLESNGKTFEYEMDLKPLINIFDDDNVPLLSRILLLTHSSNKETGKIESFFSTIKKMPKTITDDLFKSNIETNEYFKHSFLRNMNLQTDIMLHLLNHILSIEKRYDNLLGGLYGFQTEILKKLNTTMEEEKIAEDYDIINYYLSKLFLPKGKDEIEEKAYIYGLISFLCGSIEKLLRIVYKSENQNIYIKDNDITLGSLLDYENTNNKLVDMIGVNSMRCIRYYLHTEKENKRIGMNIRNEIQHLNLKKTDLNRSTCILVFRLYIEVINGLFIHYCEPGKND